MASFFCQRWGEKRQKYPLSCFVTSRARLKVIKPVVFLCRSCKCAKSLKWIYFLYFFCTAISHPTVDSNAVHVIHETMNSMRGCDMWGKVGVSVFVAAAVFASSALAEGTQAQGGLQSGGAAGVKTAQSWYGGSQVAWLMAGGLAVGGLVLVATGNGHGSVGACVLQGCSTPTSTTTTTNPTTTTTTTTPTTTTTKPATTTTTTTKTATATTTTNTK